MLHVAAAMVAAFYKKVATQEEYERVRARYGDTTSVFAHVEALTSLGLRVRFVDNADAEDVMEAIELASLSWSAGCIRATCCAVNRLCVQT